MKLEKKLNWLGFKKYNMTKSNREPDLYDIKDKF